MPKPTVDHILALKPPQQSYFLTVTIKPKLYKYSSTTQYDLTVGELAHILETCCKDYACFPELTERSNIHWHGWITFRDRLNQHTFVNKCKTNKMLGMIKINDQVITDTNRTHAYIIKDLQLTYKVINTNRILIVTNQ